MLNKLRKTGSAKSQQATLELLRSLQPFRGKPDVVLQRLLDQAQRLNLDKGAWKPAQTGPEQLFLISGKLQITDQHDNSFTLDAAMSAARFPLPDPAQHRFKALSPCQVLGLEAEKAPYRYEDTLIQCEEGGIEDQIYYDFYRTLQQGQCELPSMPDLAVRIGLAIDDPNTQSEDIARIIQSDPALTARIISVVNSAAFGSGQPITDLPQAVTRLGRAQIRSLVFSCIVKGLFRTDSKALQSRMHELWAHSCHVAAISFLLAKHTKGLSPERAMLAGLVHDIGIIPILGEARNHPQLLAKIELLDKAIDNLRAEMGSLTLRQWHLDSNLSEIALHAEDWQRIGSAVPDYIDVVQLAQLHAYIGTPRMSRLPRIDQIPAFEKLMLGELTPRKSLAILDEAEQDISEVRHLLEGD